MRLLYINFQGKFFVFFFLSSIKNDSNHINHYLFQSRRNDSYGHSPEQGGSFYKPSHYYQVVPPIESETTNISKSNFRAPFIIGLRVEESDKPVAYDEENVPIVQAGTFVSISI